MATIVTQQLDDARVDVGEIAARLGSLEPTPAPLAYLDHIAKAQCHLESARHFLGQARLIAHPAERARL